jgi:predicted membrane metal-binding protein
MPNSSFSLAALFWAYAAGIVIAFYLEPSFLVALALFTAASISAVFIRQQAPAFIEKSLLAVCLSAGIFLTSLHETQRGNLAQKLQQESVLVGKVYDRNQDLSQPWNTQLSFAVATINNEPVYGGNLKITTSTRISCSPGDTIAVRLPAQKRAGSNDDFDTYVAKEGLVAWVFIPQSAITLLESPARSWYRLMYTLKQRLAAAYAKLGTTSKALYITLFLGERIFSPLDPLKDAFNCWGIMHYLARSGLHITLFVFLWNYVLQLCGFSLRTRRWLIIPTVTVYALLTPISTSFLRGLLICGLTLGAYFVRRPYVMKHLLCLAAFGILLYSPLQLFFLDFQLSFGLTYALCCISAGMHTASDRHSSVYSL